MQCLAGSLQCHERHTCALCRGRADQAGDEGHPVVARLRGHARRCCPAVRRAPPATICSQTGCHIARVRSISWENRCTFSILLSGTRCQPCDDPLRQSIIPEKGARQHFFSSITPRSCKSVHHGVFSSCCQGDGGCHVGIRGGRGQGRDHGAGHHRRAAYAGPAGGKVGCAFGCCC